MNIVPCNDPILRQKTEQFDFNSPPFAPVEFAQQLVKTMYDNNGLGLAANQVGVPYAIFAMRGHPENFVCFNPRIIWTDDETIVLEEGCISYPNLFVKIKRPRTIRVRFQTPNGEVRTDRFEGISARIFQHELDHLNGVVFYDRANRYHRDQAMKRWKK